MHGKLNKFHENLLVLFHLLIFSTSRVCLVDTDGDLYSLFFKMADTKDDVQGVTELLAKTTVEQVNVVSFKGKSLKLNSADDGKFVLI